MKESKKIFNLKNHPYKLSMRQNLFLKKMLNKTHAINSPKIFELESEDYFLLESILRKFPAFEYYMDKYGKRREDYSKPIALNILYCDKELMDKGVENFLFKGRIVRRK